MFMYMITCEYVYVVNENMYVEFKITRMTVSVYEHVFKLRLLCQDTII